MRATIMYRAGDVRVENGPDATLKEWESTLRDSGFADIRISPKDASREFIRRWFEGRNFADCLVSATIEAVKPGLPRASVPPTPKDTSWPFCKEISLLYT